MKEKHKSMYRGFKHKGYIQEEPTTVQNTTTHYKNEGDENLKMLKGNETYEWKKGWF